MIIMRASLAFDGLSRRQRSMPLPPPGNNIFLYDAATDTTPAPIADIFAAADLSVTFPYINQTTNQLYQDTYTTLVIADNNVTGATNNTLYGELARCAQLVKADPAWAGIFDLSTGITTPLVAGENMNSTDANIMAANIIITQVGPGVDYWWGTTQFARFGVFAWGNAQRSGMEYINFQNQLFTMPERNQTTGWYCNLPPGTTGSITTYQRIQIPALTWISVTLNQSGSFPIPQ